METFLGWVLSGPVNIATQGMSTNLICSSSVMKLGCRLQEHVNGEKTILTKINEFWETENLGLSGTERIVVKEFQESISFDGNNYHVWLPWKCDPDVLPDNFTMCKSRLSALLTRLHADPKRLKEYDDIIKKQEVDGIIESVNRYEIVNLGKVHYIPHRDIIKDRETTKTRIVYDASAKPRNNPSLNDCLEKGPYQLPKLFEILIRFRARRYALVSDIKSAFLNIRIDQNDRDYLRFLWVQEVEKEEPEIVIKRFTSVLFGLKSSPFLLGATINMNKYKDINADIIEQFLNDLYMDDNITGFEER